MAGVRRYLRNNDFPLTLLASDCRSLHSPSKVTQWLGVEAVSDMSYPTMQEVSARSRDPRCRFV